MANSKYRTLETKLIAEVIAPEETLSDTSNPVPTRLMINTTAELLTVARKHGLQLNAESIKIEPSGIDFLVAFTTDEDGISWVLRVPRRSDVIEKAIYENRILNLVRDRLSVPLVLNLNCEEIKQVFR